MTMGTKTRILDLKSRRILGAGIVAFFAMSGAACSVLLDHNGTQCQTDGDCAQFGGHPYCQNGACVSSGLGPSACFYGTPQQPQDFLNQCSNAQCYAFAGYDASTLDAALVVPDAGAATTTTTTGSDGGIPTYPSCVDTNRSQVIYITGSSNFPPLLAKLAPLIIANTGFTPVYQVTSSCNGVSTVFTSETIQDPAVGSAASKFAQYFDGTASTGVPCMLGAPVAVDVGESDIFSTTCGDYVAGASVTEYLGPVQAMVFAIPGASLQTAITVDTARAVFGMGGGNLSATPWTDPTQYYVRSASTGTQQMIGHAINVPATEFWGTPVSTAAEVDQDLRSITDPAKAQTAIGIISVDWYDSDRGNVKALAYEAAQQECAYLPDSNGFKKDKQNVRDGHYPIWGPIHFFAQTGGTGLTPGAAAFVGTVSVPNPPQSLTDAFIASSLVPWCAMSVTRQTELGPLSTYSPPVQCYCHFEATVGGVTPPGCTPCTSSVQCGGSRPACNLGFCEVQ
jgi:hypothetical protein